MMGGPFQGAQVIQPEHPEDESIILDQLKLSLNDEADISKNTSKAVEKKSTKPMLDIPLINTEESIRPDVYQDPTLVERISVLENELAIAKQRLEIGSDLMQDLFKNVKEG